MEPDFYARIESCSFENLAIHRRAVPQAPGLDVANHRDDPLCCDRRGLFHDLPGTIDRELHGFGGGGEISGKLTGHIKHVLDWLHIPAETNVFLAILIFFSILKVALAVGVERFILTIKYKFVYELIIDTFKTFFNARWAFFSGNKSGVLLNTFMRESGVVGDAFGGMARMFARILLIALYLALPFYLSWRVTIVTIFFGALFAVPLTMMGRISQRLGRKNTETANRMASVVQETFNSAKVILGFANQEKSLDTYSKRFFEHVKATLNSQTFGLFLSSAYIPFGILVMIIAIAATKRFGLQISDSAVLLASLLRTIPMIGQFATYKHQIDNFYPSYEQIKRLKTEAEKLKQFSGDLKFEAIFTIIEMCDMTFSYPGRDNVLQNLNMKIPKGKMTAIVGRSGSGKSTCIDMIMGFNEPHQGQILVNGIPLQHYDIISYRKKISYYPRRVFFSI